MTATHPAAEPFVPPAPPPLPEGASWYATLSAFMRNGLSAMPRRCWDEPIIRIALPGSTLFFVTAPELIKELFAGRGDGNFGRLPTGARVLRPMLGRGLVLTEGDDWKRQRRILAPAFTPRTVEIGASHITKAAFAAVDRLAAASSQGPVDLFETMGQLSLDVALQVMFSMPGSEHGDAVRKMVAAYGPTLGRPRISDFLLPLWAPSPVELRRRAFRRRWNVLIGRLIAERQGRRAESAAPDLFDLLNENAGHTSPEEFADHVATMIVAGHETTATAMFWALYLLSEQKHIQARVAAEASAASLEDDPSGALKQLPFTHAVVQEALRLYPPAFIYGRRAVVDCTLGGEQVPKGATLLVPVWMMHRNPKVWPQADAFVPERFLGEQPDRYSFMPFGAGPTVCIGSHLAIAEAALSLAIVLRRFEVHRADAAPVLPRATLTLRPEPPPLFTLTPREPQRI